MRKLLFFSSLFIFFHCPVVAQNNLDSLILLDNSTTLNEPDTVNYYRKGKIIGIYISKGQFNKARNLFKPYRAIALKLGGKYESEFYNELVRFYGMQNELDSASIMLSKAIALNKSIENEEDLATNYFNLATIKMLKQELDSASILFFQTLDYYKHSGNKIKQVNVLQNIINLLIKGGDYSKANEYTDLASTLALELNDSIALASIYTNKAIILKQLNPQNIDTILNLQYTALDIYDKKGNLYGSARESSNIGSILWKSGNHEKGFKYLKKAEDLYLKLGKEKLLYRTYLSLGSYFYDKGQYQKSYEYYKKALPLNMDIQNQTVLSHNYLCLAKVNHKLKKYDESFKFYELVGSLKDTVETLENKKILYDVEQKYQNRIKQDSLDILSLQTEKQRISISRRNIGLVGIGLILILTSLLARYYWKFSKNQDELNKLLSSENKELIFQNNELQKVNEQLGNKTKSLNEKPILDGNKKEITIKSTDKTYFVPIDSISYIQAEDDGVRVYHDETSKWTDMSLKNFFQELDSSAFVQIGRGVVVNIKHIAWINTNTLKMKVGTELKIGRTYKPQIKKKLES